MSDADECFHGSNTAILAVRYGLFILHRVIRRDYYAIRYTRYELRYSLIGESAGFVEHQHRIDIRHHFLLINSNNALMSSMAFSGGLAGLTKGITTEGHENRNQNSNNQNYFTYRNGNTLHHFSLLSARAIFYYPGSKKRTLDYKSIIQVAGIIVNEKRA
jgi:hypothetical protein